MQLRILLELPESRLVRQGRYVTKQCTVEIVTAKRARYSCQQIATAELIIAKLPQYNTISYGLYFFPFGTAEHVWSPRGTLPTRLQLLRLRVQLCIEFMGSERT